MTKYLSRLALILGLSLWIGSVGAARSAAVQNERGLDPSRPPGSDGNRALSLDGEAAFVQVADSPSLRQFTNAITVEAWCLARSFYPSPGSVNSILRKNIEAGAENFFLRIRNADGQPLIEMGLGGEIGVLLAPAEIKTNQWFRLAGTYDGSAATVYVNGVQIKSEPMSGDLSIDASDLFIGKGDPEYSSGEYFHGVLDEIRLWNLARSPAEIQSALNTPLTGKETGLVAYWNFDDGTARDLSGHANDGRLQGDAHVVEVARPTISPAKGQSGAATAGTERLTLEKRLEVVEALWRNLSEIHPALEYKGIRGREWIEPAVRRAREAKSDQGFYDVLLEQMASLRDTHTRIISYPGQPKLESPPVVLNKVEGKVAVIRADPATTLRAGEVIVSVEERPVEECLAEQMRRVCNSTERGRVREACGQLLRGLPGTTVTVSAQGTNGVVRRVTLRRESKPEFWQEPAIAARPLGDSIGYIRIARWSDDTIPEQFDQALETFKTTRGLIIDVRGNGGGNDQLADLVNGRLIAKPVISSIDFWREAGTDQYHRTVFWVQPRGPWTYQGRLAVLIDEASMSACEHFVSGVEAMGTVLLVGLPTNGAGGGPTIINLPDGTRVAISRALGLRVNGVVFEGHGIPPHIYSAPTLNDLRTGRDAALDLAQEWIGSGKDLPSRVQPLSGPINPGAYAADSRPRDGFKSPARAPHTHYAIEVAANASNRRLEGREEIRLENVPIPLRRLVIDWPYAASEELAIRFGHEPVKILSKGTNGLSDSQILIELPEIIQKGKSASLEIQFGLPLRLEKITKLTDWHPRLDWGRNTVADYEVKLRAPPGCLVATSGAFDSAKETYSASGCRVFGLVFMNGLKVLTAKSGDTEIRSYYDGASRKCVEFTHQTAVEVIDFYRQWLGFYPHKVLHIIPGGLGHPAGGYPVATAIVGIHGQARMASAPESHWRFITAHEIGHQYWMEHVLEAPDTFWLMIGLGVYADRAFMLAHEYGDKHERDMMARYIQGVRDQLDTRMDRLPEEMEEVAFDYNNVVNHGKGFAVISALACTLGRPAFEAAYKRCLAEFRGRTLAAPDFRRVCEEESGETLDWFFEQWVRTSRFLSYEIASQETVSVDGSYVTKVTLRNQGTLSMPVPITATFEDGPVQRLFTDRLRDEAPLAFRSRAPVRDLVVDAAHELPLVVPPPEATAGQLKQEINRLRSAGEADKALRIYAKAKPATLEKLGASQLFKLGMSLFDGDYLKESLQVFQECAASQQRAGSDDKLLGWAGHAVQYRR